MIRTAAIAALAMLFASPALTAERWTAARANAWYDAQPWLVGSNYTPATAINQLEMWQADTFDPATIERELAWARGAGLGIDA